MKLEDRIATYLIWQLPARSKVDLRGRRAVLEYAMRCTASIRDLELPPDVLVAVSWVVVKRLLVKRGTPHGSF